MYTNQTDGTDIATWNLPEGATVRLGRGWISGGMAFSPDGEALVVATTIGCWRYDLNTMKLRAWWNTERGMLSDIAFSQDARWIATGNWDGDVMVFDTQNLQCVAQIGIPKNPKGVMGAVRSLRFSQDGQHLTFSYLIVRLDDGPFSRNRTGRGRYFTVYNWKADTNTPIASFMAPPKLDRWNFGHDTFSPHALSPDGSLLAYTSNPNFTSVMHVETGETIAEFPDNYTDSHWKGCHKLVFSPCGKYLAACDRNKFHVWNVQNGTLEIPPAEYMENRQIHKILLTYTSNGALQVAGLTSSEVVIWDGTKQETMDTFECWRPSDGCFSTDGTQLAITNGHGELQLWTKDTLSTVKSLPTHLSGGIVDVRFSKDGRTLLSCYENNPAGYKLWDIEQRQIKRTFHSPFGSSVGTVSTSRSRELLAAVEDKRIRVWNLTSDTQIAELLGASMKVDIVFSPTEEYLATVSRQATIVIWHLASNTQIAELSQNPSSRVFRMGFSRTGKYFVSVYADGFTIWDTLRWEKHHHVPLPEQSSKSWKLLFHPNDNLLITRILDGPTLVWDLKSGEQIGALDTTVCLDPSLYKATQQDIQKLYEQSETSHPRLWTLSFSRCGTLIAGGIRHGKMGEIRFWDATTLETRMVIIPPTGCQKPQTLRFSPCGNFLAVGAQWQEGQERVSVRLWDVNTGKNIHTFWGPPTDVWSIDFSPDGELLASGSYDGTILLWDVKSITGS
ncbi:MAG: WD40 repeat domain-containing protein [Candidatus Poribacteria bacterium]|nr:WD40 repeat domain-containing protein [Candidatus Poribacteria bacterium]